MKTLERRDEALQNTVALMWCDIEEQIENTWVKLQDKFYDETFASGRISAFRRVLWDLEERLSYKDIEDIKIVKKYKEDKKIKPALTDEEFIKAFK